MERNSQPNFMLCRFLISEKLTLGLTTNGFWNCGFEVCAPKVLKFLTLSLLSRRMTALSVGRPGTPASTLMLCCPARYGVLPPCVQVKPMRASIVELGVKVWVTPAAIWRL